MPLVGSNKPDRSGVGAGGDKTKDTPNPSRLRLGLSIPPCQPSSDIRRSDDFTN